MATRGLYPPSGSGRDLYMNDLVPVPLKKPSVKPPRANNIVLACRTDPPPRYFPNGGGRDLFNCVEGSGKKEERPTEGIMARKIPDELCKINKLTVEQKRKRQMQQNASCSRLSSVNGRSNQRSSAHSPPRSPKRSHLQHVSPLIVDQNVLKKFLNTTSKWK